MAQLSVEDRCPLCCGAALRILHRFEQDSHYVATCGNCTVQTILPHPTTAELKQFYASYHNTRTPDAQIPFLTGAQVALLEHLRAQWHVRIDGMRYMELGFGNGAALLAASRAGMRVWGYDLDPENVNDVTRRAQAMGLQVHVERGDLNGPGHSGEFDFIRASQLIEHLIDPIQFIQSMHDLLAPGGYLYLECPNNTASFLRIKNLLRKRFGRTDFYNSLRLTEHLWGFNRVSMTRMLRAHSYEVVFCTDYPVRHPYFQPENLFWYPSLTSGLGQSLSARQLYPTLKSLIAVFDGVASTGLSGGIGLATLARKNLLRNRPQNGA